MKLRDLTSRLDDAVASGDLEPEFHHITYDSRKVKLGSVFVAIRGTKSDGHDFIQTALDAGASAIIAETAPPLLCQRAWFHVKSSRKALAEIAQLYYGDPSYSMKVGAVTGTNGKTTTAFVLHHLLNHGQMRCGLLGTVVYDVGGELRPVTHTTPESLELQELLKEMKDHGCRSVALEASSHALDQERLYGMNLSAAIFTNLTQDHLDYHGTMEKYFLAKAKLFEAVHRIKSAKMVINLDDMWGKRLLSVFKDSDQVVTFGLGANAQYRAVNPRYDSTGTTFELEFGGRSLLVRTPLIGQFNVSNVLGALAAANAMGCNLRDSVKALASVPQVPGRMERVTERERFHVFVDYAHTPDGLVNALNCARGLKPSRIITVFGCGGDRDRAKRPLMAQAAQDGSDICILTSDNPRTESPAKILEETRKGFSTNAYTVIEDRREAIQTAINNAREGDLILIAGKGHETYQEIDGVKHPFDDRKVARQAVDQLIRSIGDKRLQSQQKRESREAKFRQ